ncbi:MAG: hypothetical protein NUV98_05390 [Candidatus Roizmanbacteria bacterium]|nr:hypothetical protein [Candidatus Roizmanbacteria bacterium]
MKISAPVITIISLCLLTGIASWRTVSTSTQVKGIFTASPEPTQEESTATPTAVLTSTPTSAPLPTATPQPTATSIPADTNNTSTSLSSWQYPGSTVTAQSDNSLTLTSRDNPDTITDWYKSKIDSNGYSTRSFVTTKSNGQVKNVLVGAKGGNEIRIEMEKPADSQTTTIKVSQS